MKLKELNRKGVAGTEVVIQLMIAVFVIGLLAMLIAITGSQLLDSTTLTETSGTQTKLHDGILLVNNTVARQLNGTSSYNGAICTITSAHNYSNRKTIPTGNYTESSECYIKGTSTMGTLFKNQKWGVNYTFTYERTSAGGLLINETMLAVSDVPDNFSLWLVVGGLVVVIGLIAFVILTLRGTGMMGGQQ